jgi:glycosyltransferase involved in cell wall biosynthesis
MVEDGVNGWLFRDGDADDLAEKILSSIKNRRLFKKIGESGVNREQKADWEKNFGKLLEAYETTVRVRRT